VGLKPESGTRLNSAGQSLTKPHYSSIPGGSENRESGTRLNSAGESLTKPNYNYSSISRGSQAKGQGSYDFFQRNPVQ